MRVLDHPNVVALKHCFFSKTEKEELYLNLVLEYVPETAHRVIKHYNKMNQRMPHIYVKLYAYQLIFLDIFFIMQHTKVPDTLLTCSVAQGSGSFQTTIASFKSS
jgi:hypothetical protein